MSNLSTIEQVQAFVLDACAPLPPRRVPVGAAVGLVLAEEVVADESVPPFDNSAMDGFAVRSDDTHRGPVHLSVVGELMAGEAPSRDVRAGEAIRIMTGAPMPAGADAVCPIEDVRAAGHSVAIDRPVHPGMNVRLAGEDVAAGSGVFGAGTVLAPAHIGVLASLGIETVIAHPRPRVGVLSTGDELVAPSAPLGLGQVRDANRPALLAVLAQSDFETVDLGIVGDDKKAVVAALDGGRRVCDAVVSSGGVSFGDRDAVRDAIGILSITRAARSFEVAIRPAKPFTFGVLGEGVPAFGLPGNPVSAMIAFELFCRPALLRLSGATVFTRPQFAAVADERIPRRRDGKVHFVRVVALLDEHGKLHARSAGAQNPHMLHAMSGSNALAVVADGDGVDAGGELQLLLIDPDRIGMAT